TSNNEAEYEDLVAGLELAIHMEAKCLEVYTNSLLIANQVKGLYEAREELMKRYLEKVRELQEYFCSFAITQIPRSKNKRVDALSKLESSSFVHLTKSVLVEVVPHRSIEVKAVSTVEEPGPEQANYPATRTNNTPTTMGNDEHLESMALAPWGIDIVGPFPEASGRVKFLIVAIDYFTRWVEAEPVATISSKKILQFVWRNIVCRFSIPGIIICDNRKQFTSNPFQEWCEELKIKQNYTSVAHPQANGQTEVTNQTILHGLKTRLGKAKGQWVKELPNFLWAYHKTAHATNVCPPHSLVYGSKSVLPRK
ncbi:reverse transcriptase domain-containing protein, partial [Tanacetum coccineum]